MPDPYASVIAVLYGVGLVLLLAALPVRLKALRRAENRKAKPPSPVSQVDAGFDIQTSSMLAADAKGVH